MKLVIVESPSKAKKIREFLGAGFRVAASFGHVRDLPVSGDLAVAFGDGKVKPTYKMLDRAAKAIGELSAMAKQAEEVLLATDPDREGEAIAWHVSQLLGERPYRRVVFHAVTKAEVQKAVANPRPLDLRLVDAQQARRVLDRVVGWLVSPTLRRIGKQAKSAGRVQSVALRLVAEREREIGKFNVVDYFILSAKLEKPASPPPFSAKLVAWKSRPLAQRLRDPAVAEKTVEWCKRQEWRVLSCERREVGRNAPPPFSTATVQQAASVRLGLNPDVAMKLLQGLFDNGHITYHRTDSNALAPEAIEEARKIIARDFPPPYLPKDPIIHATKSANAQEAHEAIRPTHPESGQDALGGADDGKLYRLIWQRFIAGQMAPGRDQHTTIDVACAPGAWNPESSKPALSGKGEQSPSEDGSPSAAAPMGVFQAKGKVTLFDGWRKLAGEDSTEEAKLKSKGGKKGEDGEAEDEESEDELPMLEAGDALS
ncbi:MAG: DNA topoisomerase, partial [candidate division NC10 bacterium]